MRCPETLVASNKLFQLWHVDPKGDSGPPCHDPGNWKWHIRHWKFGRPIWTHQLQARFLRKCYVCGERGSKRDCVNVWDWRGYKHHRCLSTKAPKTKGGEK